MFMRLGGIVLVVVLLSFGGYKIFANRVTWTDPQSVSRAFLIALKHQNVSRAKKYYVPDKADAWAVATSQKLEEMRSFELDRFQAAIPDEPTFVAAASPKGSTDTTFTSGEVQVSLQEINGAWYVSKSPY